MHKKVIALVFQEKDTVITIWKFKDFFSSSRLQYRIGKWTYIVCLIFLKEILLQ